jgi:ElaB/YqjD/DUF883 family membrane-anchored ribosome-binding protein
MTNVARLLVLDQDSAEIKDSQTAIANLLDKEAEAQKIYDDLPSLADQLERVERGAQLYADCADMVDLAKELEAILSRVRKRMVGMQGIVKAGLTEEAVAAGGEIETANWKLKMKRNPPKVIIDDLSVVPKKYRLEPMPIPEWQEWDADKNVIKQALTKEKVQSIAGVHLEVSERVEIKPR